MTWPRGCPWLLAWPISTSGLILALVAPSIGLLIQANLRPQPSGLAALVARTERVRSARVQASAEVPDLWIRYLGPSEANRRWSVLDRQLWWMAFPHDGEPVLALPTSGDIALFYADALHAEADRTAARRLGSSADSATTQDCLVALTRGPALLWTPSAVERLTGPLAPLFRQLGYGCLHWRMHRQQLEILGVVSEGRLRSEGFPSPGMVSPRSSWMTQPSATSEPPLLELELLEASWLLQGLLDQSVLQQALAQNYGLDSERLDRLLKLPLRLRIHPSEQPGVQASLEFDFVLSRADERLFEPSLQAIALTLKGYGMQANRVQGSTLWSKESTTGSPVLGGWHRFVNGVWRFSLGAVPRQDEARPPAPTTMLQLRLKPSRFNQLGWLDSTWPEGLKSGRIAEFHLAPIDPGAASTQQQRQFSVRGQLALF